MIVVRKSNLNLPLQQPQLISGILFKNVQLFSQPRHNISHVWVDFLQLQLHNATLYKIYNLVHLLLLWVSFFLNITFSIKSPIAISPTYDLTEQLLKHCCKDKVVQSIYVYASSTFK